MDVYLIDGTYELFRHFFAVPSSKDASGQEIGAVRGVLTSVLSMIERGATHFGVATDHVVERFGQLGAIGTEHVIVGLSGVHEDGAFEKVPDLVAQLNAM